ncbi:NUDIX hydrolase [Chloroflexota bacterium]
MEGLPPGDSRRYPKSPRVSAHTTILNGNKVLLIKRAGEPYKGTWAPPGGGIELGETVYEAGKREVREESAVEVEIEGILKIDDHIRLDEEGKVEVHTILIRLLSRYVSGTPKAGSDAADVGWYTVDELDGLNMRPTIRDMLIRVMS